MQTNDGLVVFFVKENLFTIFQHINEIKETTRIVSRTLIDSHMINEPCLIALSDYLQFGVTICPF